MILLNYTNALQSFAVTLSEKTSIVAPTYLFSFKHEIKKTSFSVILQDISPCPARYNLFQMIGTAFPSSGWYTYEAREQLSPTNITPALSGAIVETGRVFIKSSDIEYTQKDNEVNFIEP